MTAAPPRRREAGEPRCDRWMWCGLPGGHPGDECVVMPQAGMQEAVASCSADGALFGGAVQAGKSALLLMDPLRHIHVPGFTALILRKEQRDLERPDGLWAKALQLYSRFGGEPKSSEYKFTFGGPDGATIQLGFVDSKNYERDHQGSRACFLGFDELTHFTRQQFIYLLLRNGSACGVTPYWRATCNPDRDSWLRGFVDWWIGADGWPRQDRAAVPRYYLIDNSRFVWGLTPDEVLGQVHGSSPEEVSSFAFFPGSLEENLFRDTRQQAKLALQDEEMRKRWRGNWNAGDPRGKAFDPLWFRQRNGELREDLLVDRVPDGAVRMRIWDLAATAEADAGSNTSYSAGPELALHEGVLYFADLEIGRWGPAEVEKRVRDVAEADGREVPVWFCQERAGAGKRDLAHWGRLLAGWDVQGAPETGDKGVRLRPLIALAERGAIRIVRDRPERRWNETLVQHLLYLTKDGKGRPNDVGDAAAAGLERLAELGQPINEEVVEAVVAANPTLITPSGSGPRFGSAPRTGVGGGRFRLK